jgi:hypothetical protein
VDRSEHRLPRVVSIAKTTAIPLDGLDGVFLDTSIDFSGRAFHIAPAPTAGYGVQGLSIHSCIKAKILDFNVAHESILSIVVCVWASRVKPGFA